MEVWCSHFGLTFQIVNSYLARIAQFRPQVFAVSSFLFPKLRQKDGYRSVRRWYSVDLLTYDIILFPIYAGRHWFLVVRIIRQIRILTNWALSHDSFKIFLFIFQFIELSYGFRRELKVRISFIMLVMSNILPTIAILKSGNSVWPLITVYEMYMQTSKLAKTATLNLKLTLRTSGLNYNCATCYLVCRCPPKTDVHLRRFGQWWQLFDRN